MASYSKTDFTKKMLEKYELSHGLSEETLNQMIDRGFIMPTITQNNQDKYELPLNSQFERALSAFKDTKNYLTDFELKNKLSEHDASFESFETNIFNQLAQNNLISTDFYYEVQTNKLYLFSPDLIGNSEMIKAAREELDQMLESEVEEELDIFDELIAEVDDEQPTEQPESPTPSDLEITEEYDEFFDEEPKGKKKKNKKSINTTVLPLSDTVDINTEYKSEEHSVLNTEQQSSNIEPISDTNNTDFTNEEKYEIADKILSNDDVFQKVNEATKTEQERYVEAQNLRYETERKIEEYKTFTDTVSSSELTNENFNKTLKSEDKESEFSKESNSSDYSPSNFQAIESEHSSEPNSTFSNTSSDNSSFVIHKSEELKELEHQLAKQKESENKALNDLIEARNKVFDSYSAESTPKNIEVSVINGLTVEKHLDTGDVYIDNRKYIDGATGERCSSGYGEHEEFSKSTIEDINNYSTPNSTYNVQSNVPKTNNSSSDAHSVASEWSAEQINTVETYLKSDDAYQKIENSTATVKEEYKNYQELVSQHEEKVKEIETKLAEAKEEYKSVSVYNTERKQELEHIIQENTSAETIAKQELEQYKRDEEETKEKLIQERNKAREEQYRNYEPKNTVTDVINGVTVERNLQTGDVYIDGNKYIDGTTGQRVSTGYSSAESITEETQTKETFHIPQRLVSDENSIDNSKKASSSTNHTENSKANASENTVSVPYTVSIPVSENTYMVYETEIKTTNPELYSSNDNSNTRAQAAYVLQDKALSEESLNKIFNEISERSTSEDVKVSIVQYDNDNNKVVTVVYDKENSNTSTDEISQAYKNALNVETLPAYTEEQKEFEKNAMFAIGIPQDGKREGDIYIPPAVATAHPQAWEELKEQGVKYIQTNNITVPIDEMIQASKSSFSVIESEHFANAAIAEKIISESVSDNNLYDSSIIKEAEKHYSISAENQNKFNYTDRIDAEYDTQKSANIASREFQNNNFANNESTFSKDNTVQIQPTDEKASSTVVYKVSVPVNQTTYMVYETEITTNNPEAYQTSDTYNSRAQAVYVLQDKALSQESLDKLFMEMNEQSSNKDVKVSLVQYDEENNKSVTTLYDKNDANTSIGEIAHAYQQALKIDSLPAYNESQKEYERNAFFAIGIQQGGQIEGDTYIPPAVPAAHPQVWENLKEQGVKYVQTNNTTVSIDEMIDASKSSFSVIEGTHFANAAIAEKILQDSVKNGTSVPQTLIAEAEKDYATSTRTSTKFDSIFGANGSDQSTIPTYIREKSKEDSKKAVNTDEIDKNSTIKTREGFGAKRKLGDAGELHPAAQGQSQNQDGNGVLTHTKIMPSNFSGGANSSKLNGTAKDMILDGNITLDYSKPEVIEKYAATIESQNPDLAKNIRQASIEANGTIAIMLANRTAESNKQFDNVIKIDGAQLLQHPELYIEGKAYQAEEMAKYLEEHGQTQAAQNIRKVSKEKNGAIAAVYENQTIAEHALTVQAAIKTAQEMLESPEKIKNKAKKVENIAFIVASEDKVLSKRLRAESQKQNGDIANQLASRHRDKGKFKLKANDFTEAKISNFKIEGHAEETYDMIKYLQQVNPELAEAIKQKSLEVNGNATLIYENREKAILNAEEFLKNTALIQGNAVLVNETITYLKDVDPAKAALLFNMSQQLNGELATILKNGSADDVVKHLAAEGLHYIVNDANDVILLIDQLKNSHPDEIAGLTQMANQVLDVTENKQLHTYAQLGNDLSSIKNNTAAEIVMLIEANRLSNPNLLSEIMKTLPEDKRANVIAQLIENANIKTFNKDEQAEIKTKFDNSLTKESLNEIKSNPLQALAVIKALSTSNVELASKILKDIEIANPGVANFITRAINADYNLNGQIKTGLVSLGALQSFNLYTNFTGYTNPQQYTDQAGGSPPHGNVSRTRFASVTAVPFFYANRRKNPTEVSPSDWQLGNIHKFNKYGRISAENIKLSTNMMILTERDSLGRKHTTITTLNADGTVNITMNANSRRNAVTIMGYAPGLSEINIDEIQKSNIFKKSKLLHTATRGRKLIEGQLLNKDGLGVFLSPGWLKDTKRPSFKQRVQNINNTDFINQELSKRAETIYNQFAQSGLASLEENNSKYAIGIHTNKAVVIDGKAVDKTILIEQRSKILQRAGRQIWLYAIPVRELQNTALGTGYKKLFGRGSAVYMTHHFLSAAVAREDIKILKQDIFARYASNSQLTIPGASSALSFNSAKDRAKIQKFLSGQAKGEFGEDVTRLSSHAIKKIIAERKYNGITLTDAQLDIFKNSLLLRGFTEGQLELLNIQEYFSKKGINLGRNYNLNSLADVKSLLNELDKLSNRKEFTDLLGSFKNINGKNTPITIGLLSDDRISYLLSGAVALPAELQTLLQETQALRNFKAQLQEKKGAAQFHRKSITRQATMKALNSLRGSAFGDGLMYFYSKFNKARMSVNTIREIKEAINLARTSMLFKLASADSGTFANKLFNSKFMQHRINKRNAKFAKKESKRLAKEAKKSVKAAKKVARADRRRAARKVRSSKRAAKSKFYRNSQHRLNKAGKLLRNTKGRFSKFNTKVKGIFDKITSPFKAVTRLINKAKEEILKRIILPVAKYAAIFLGVLIGLEILVNFAIVGVDTVYGIIYDRDASKNTGEFSDLSPEKTLVNDRAELCMNLDSMLKYYVESFPENEDVVKNVEDNIPDIVVDGKKINEKKLFYDPATNKNLNLKKLGTTLNGIQTGMYYTYYNGDGEEIGYKSNAKDIVAMSNAWIGESYYAKGIYKSYVEKLWNYSHMVAYMPRQQKDGHYVYSCNSQDPQAECYENQYSYYCNNSKDYVAGVNANSNNTYNSHVYTKEKAVRQDIKNGVDKFTQKAAKTVNETKYLCKSCNQYIPSANKVTISGTANGYSCPNCGSKLVVLKNQTTIQNGIANYSATGCSQHVLTYHRPAGSGAYDATNLVLNYAQYAPLQAQLPNGMKTNIKFYYFSDGSAVPKPNGCSNWQHLNFSFRTQSGVLKSSTAYYCPGCCSDCGEQSTTKTTVNTKKAQYHGNSKHIIGVSTTNQTSPSFAQNCINVAKANNETNYTFTYDYIRHGYNSSNNIVRVYADNRYHTATPQPCKNYASSIGYTSAVCKIARYDDVTYFWKTQDRTATGYRTACITAAKAKADALPLESNSGKLLGYCTKIVIDGQTTKFGTCDICEEKYSYSETIGSTKVVAYYCTGHYAMSCSGCYVYKCAGHLINNPQQISLPYCNGFCPGHTIEHYCTGHVDLNIAQVTLFLGDDNDIAYLGIPNKVTSETKTVHIKDTSDILTNSYEEEEREVQTPADDATYLYQSHSSLKKFDYKKYPLPDPKKGMSSLDLEADAVLDPGNFGNPMDTIRYISKFTEKHAKSTLDEAIKSLYSEFAASGEWIDYNDGGNEAGAFTTDISHLKHEHSKTFFFNRWFYFDGFFVYDSSGNLEKVPATDKFGNVIAGKTVPRDAGPYTRAIESSKDDWYEYYGVSFPGAYNAKPDKDELNRLLHNISVASSYSESSLKITTIKKLLENIGETYTGNGIKFAVDWYQQLSTNTSKKSTVNNALLKSNAFSEYTDKAKVFRRELQVKSLSDANGKDQDKIDNAIKNLKVGDLIGAGDEVYLVLYNDTMMKDITGTDSNGYVYSNTPKGISKGHVIVTTINGKSDNNANDSIHLFSFTTEYISKRPDLFWVYKN